MPEIIRTTEPFFYPGSRATGCLLVHGFTSTPKEMRPVGEYLASLGYPALGIRLFGHGTQPADMNRAHYQDWLTNLEEGWEMLQPHCKQVVLIGQSMGGALVLTFAGLKLRPLAGVISMEAPAVVPSKRPYMRRLQRLPTGARVALLKGVSLVYPFLPKPAHRHTGTPTMAGHVSYSKNPVRAGAELVLLLEKLNQVIPAIDVPTLLIHSRVDDYVPFQNMVYIYNRLTTPRKERVWLEKSSHLVTQDVEQPVLFQALAQFLEKQTISYGGK